MSVLIKGMKMPKSCGLCRFDDYGYCTMEKRYSDASATYRRASFCPLVELPEKHLLRGEWLRMSDLSETDDNRYKCSRCGNVIHHKSRMDLYTFNRWCGRCGSDNSRHTMNIEVDKWEEDAPVLIEAEGE